MPRSPFVRRIPAISGARKGRPLLGHSADALMGPAVRAVFGRGCGVGVCVGGWVGGSGGGGGGDGGGSVVVVVVVVCVCVW